MKQTCCRKQCPQSNQNQPQFQYLLPCNEKCFPFQQPPAQLCPFQPGWQPEGGRTSLLKGTPSEKTHITMHYRCYITKKVSVCGRSTHIVTLWARHFLLFITKEWTKWLPPKELKSEVGSPKWFWKSIVDYQTLYICIDLFYLISVIPILCCSLE